MKLKRLFDFGGAHRRGIVVVALMTMFSGVALVIDRPKGTILEWLAVPLIALGAACFTWAIWPVAEAWSQPAAPFLFSRILSRVTRNRRLISLLPAVGVSVILSDLVYNLFLSANRELLTEDTIVLLLGGVLIAYPLFPERFARERDFALAFFLALNLILVLPLLAVRAYYQDFERSVDVYSWVALAPETSGVLSLVGVKNAVHSVPGASAPGLTFQPRGLAFEVTIVITTACSGIYSFGIFAAAFIAFVLTEYEKMTRRLWTFLGFGLLTAYAANVLRMTVIILVGYYTDSAQTDLQNMLTAHSYAGWLIFIGWIALFWSVLFRTLPLAANPGSTETIRSRYESVCSICHSYMTPTIAAQRCTCGLFVHKACASAVIKCPVCAQPFAHVGPMAIGGN